MALSAVRDRGPASVAVAEIGAGRAVVVVDDLGQPAVVIAAEHVSAQAIMLMRRRAGGWVFLALAADRCDALGLAPMGQTGPRRDIGLTMTAEDLTLTPTIDAVTGITNGVSASDQATTIRTAVMAKDASELVSPGHVQPVRVHPHGVHGFHGRSEAGVELARLAGLQPAALIAEIQDENAAAASPEEARELAKVLGLAVITIGEVAAHRPSRRPRVERVAGASMPTRYGDFVAVGYRSLIDESEHVALIKGDVRGPEPVLVHVHRRCVAGDVFHSLRCDCGTRLDEALRTMEQIGRGVLVYRARDGQNVELLTALREHAAEEAGEASLSRVATFDSTACIVVAAIIRELGLQSVHVLSNDALEVACLKRAGAPVDRVLPLDRVVGREDVQPLRRRAAPRR